MDEKQEKLKEKYMEMQMLDQQIKQAQKQIQMIEQQVNELNNVKQNLDNIKSVDEDTEVLSSISSGIFVKAKIGKADKLLVNVGADVMVEKDIDSTKELIDQQIKEMHNVQMQTDGEMQKLAQRASSLQNELAKLVE